MLQYRPRTTKHEWMSRLNPLASEFIPSSQKKQLTPASALRIRENVQRDGNSRSTSIDFVSNLTENELKSRINAEFDDSNFRTSPLNDLFKLFAETNSYSQSNMKRV